jgi:heparin binding hemagglutinin HbhA
MPKSRFELPAQLPENVARPLYAGVGATERAVEILREYVSDVQKRFGEVQKEVQKTVSGIDYEPRALRTEAQKRAQHATEQARKVVNARVESLNKNVTEDAQARRAAVEKRVAELQAELRDWQARFQKLLDEQLDTAGGTYGELVTRGESLVGRIRGQQSTQEAEQAVKTTAAKAKTTKTQAAKTAKSAKKSAQATAKKSATAAKKSPAKSSAKATATSAQKAAESTAGAAAEAAPKVGDGQND